MDVFADLDGLPLMVPIPAGTFPMGSPETEIDRSVLEGPTRGVTFARPFGIARDPVTVAQFARFIAASGHDMAPGGYDARDEDAVEDPSMTWQTPGYAVRADLPVTCVNLADAQAYAGWLSSLTGRAYRLPSEAEWEYACRAGTTTRFAFGDSLGLGQAAFDIGHEAGRQPQPVGSYPPNAFGLHDMHGNVWEWCADAATSTYDGAPTDGSARRDGDAKRGVLRGGSWADAPRYARSASRNLNWISLRWSAWGFRVACDL